MKFVIQRVNNADVTVDNKIVGSIGKGFLILFGACETDTADMLPKFVDKIVKLRIFADENGNKNTSSFLSINIKFTILCRPIPKLELDDVVSSVLTSVI